MIYYIGKINILLFVCCINFKKYEVFFFFKKYKNWYVIKILIWCFLFDRNNRKDSFYSFNWWFVLCCNVLNVNKYIC